MSNINKKRDAELSSRKFPKCPNILQILRTATKLLFFMSSFFDNMAILSFDIRRSW